MINRYSASFAPVTLQTLPASRKVAQSVTQDPAPQPAFRGKGQQKSASTWFTLFLLGASIFGAYKVLENKIIKPEVHTAGQTKVQAKEVPAK